MIRLLCPVCGRQQEVPEEKEFIFCRYCGLRMNVAEVAAMTASAEAAEAPAESKALLESEAAAVPAEAAESPAGAGIAEIPAMPDPYAGAETQAPQDLPAASEESGGGEKPKKKGKGLIIGLVAALLVLGGAAAAYFLLLKPANDYKAAEELMAAGSYAEAIEAFEALGDYKDARANIDACLLQKAIEEVKTGKYSRSLKTLKSIEDKSLNTNDYDKAAEDSAAALIRSGAFSEAKEMVLALDPHIKDLQAPVRERFTALLEDENAAAGSYDQAAELLSLFRDQLTDTSFVTDVLGKKCSGLIEKGRYAEASSLLKDYSDLALDLSEAVLTAFTGQLETGNYGSLAALLNAFSDQIGERGAYEDAVKEKMNALLAEEKDDEVLNLYEAAYSLNGDAILSETVKEAMRKSAGELDAARVNSLLRRYSFYVSPLDQAEDQVISMIAMAQNDEALAFMEQLDASYFDFDPLKYEIAGAYLEHAEFDKAIALYETLGTYQNSAEHLNEAKYGKAQALLAEGECVKASALFTELGDYKDSAEMVKECLYQIVQNTAAAIRAGKVYGAAEMQAFYELAGDLIGYKDAESYQNLAVQIWIFYLINLPDHSLEYALTFNDAVSLTQEQKAALLETVIIGMTPPLAFYDENGSFQTASRDMIDGLLIVMEKQYGGEEDETAQAMLSYLRYLSVPNDENLVSADTVRTLWPLRPDIQDFCADGDPLMIFLCGDWVLPDAEEPIFSLVQKEGGGFHLTYDLPLEIPSGYLSVEDKGFSVVDEDGNELGRICEITIIGLDIIEIYNVADQKTYTLTRMAEEN